MKRKILLLIFILLALAIGISAVCGYVHTHANWIPSSAMQALENPEHLTLYSIEPELRIPYPDSVERLHGHPVLGSLPITSAETRASIVQAIQHGVAHWNRQRYLCFDPRHAVRVVCGSQTYDFLICYECHRIDIYRGDTTFATVGITDSPDILNGILRVSNIPLPEPMQPQRR